MVKCATCQKELHSNIYTDQRRYSYCEGHAHNQPFAYRDWDKEPLKNLDIQWESAMLPEQVALLAWDERKTCLVCHETFQLTDDVTAIWCMPYQGHRYVHTKCREREGDKDNE